MHISKVSALAVQIGLTAAVVIGQAAVPEEQDVINVDLVNAVETGVHVLEERQFGPPNFGPEGKDPRQQGNGNNWFPDRKGGKHDDKKDHKKDKKKDDHDKDHKKDKKKDHKKDHKKDDKHDDNKGGHVAKREPQHEQNDHLKEEKHDDKKGHKEDKKKDKKKDDHKKDKKKDNKHDDKKEDGNHGGHLAKREPQQQGGFHGNNNNNDDHKNDKHDKKKDKHDKKKDKNDKKKDRHDKKKDKDHKKDNKKHEEPQNHNSNNGHPGQQGHQQGDFQGSNNNHQFENNKKDDKHDKKKDKHDKKKDKHDKKKDKHDKKKNKHNDNNNHQPQPQPQPQQNENNHHLAPRSPQGFFDKVKGLFGGGSSWKEVKEKAVKSAHETANKWRASHGKPQKIDWKPVDWNQPPSTKKMESIPPNYKPSFSSSEEERGGYGAPAITKEEKKRRKSLYKEHKKVMKQHWKDMKSYKKDMEEQRKRVYGAANGGKAYKPVEKMDMSAVKVHGWEKRQALTWQERVANALQAGKEAEQRAKDIAANAQQHVEEVVKNVEETVEEVVKNAEEVAATAEQNWEEVAEAAEQTGKDIAQAAEEDAESVAKDSAWTLKARDVDLPQVEVTNNNEGIICKWSKYAGAAAAAVEIENKENAYGSPGPFIPKAHVTAIPVEYNPNANAAGDNDWREVVSSAQSLAASYKSEYSHTPTPVAGVYPTHVPGNSEVPVYHGSDISYSYGEGGSYVHVTVSVTPTPVSGTNTWEVIIPTSSGGLEGHEAAKPSASANIVEANHAAETREQRVMAGAVVGAGVAALAVAFGLL